MTKYIDNYEPKSGKWFTIGFTGSREGMNTEQYSNVFKYIQKILEMRRIGGFSPTETIGLHGDCIGADADFDRLMKGHHFYLLTEIRPCWIKKAKAHCDSPAIAEAKHPLERNRDIVADADVMFACPPTNSEILRSGTWATIRYTREAKKPLIIFYPDGRVEREIL